MVTKPVTGKIRLAFQKVMALEAAMPELVAPQVFWKARLPMKDRVEFLMALGAARSALWQEVLAEYPDLADVLTSVEITNAALSCSALESPQSVDAVDPVVGRVTD